MQNKNLMLNNEINKIEKRNFITYLVTNLLCLIFAIINLIFISLMKINSNEIKNYNKYSYLLLFQFILSLILITQSFTYFKKSDEVNEKNKKILIIFRTNILLIISLSLYFIFSVFIFFSFVKSSIKASESEIKTIIERTKTIKLITLIVLAIYLTFILNNLILFSIKNKNLFKKIVNK